MRTHFDVVYNLLSVSDHHNVVTLSLPAEVRATLLPQHLLYPGAEDLHPVAESQLGLPASPSPHVRNSESSSSADFQYLCIEIRRLL